MTSTPQELKPCPFCGCNELIISNRTSGHGESTPYIKCMKCGVEMPDYYGNPSKKWNARCAERKEK